MMERGRRKYIKSNKGEKVNNTYSNSPILQAFQEFSSELDEKHDRYERIVKTSRDITISSKRVIFALHALIRSNQYEEDLKKIDASLKSIRHMLKNVALEIKDIDPYQFLRAFSPGLQEYIEALTFYHFIVNGNLFNLGEMENDLTFKEKLSEKGEDGSAVDQQTYTVPLVLPLTEYLLGIQDLTGELMRHCISSFGAGRIDNGFGVCNFVKCLYTGLLYLGNVHNREFTKKLYIAKQSLEKMEMACYTAHVRGSESLQFQPDTDESQRDMSFSLI